MEKKVRTEIPPDSIIKLMEHDKTFDVSLMQALSDRKSQREFSDKQISLEELSSLLWTANDINREDGRRTTPSASNPQNIDIYVCMASGAYLYDAKKSQLSQITTEDLRFAVDAQQKVVAPVFLVMVDPKDYYDNNKVLTC